MRRRDDVFWCNFVVEVLSVSLNAGSEIHIESGSWLT
jgi:hypothetical protein